MHLTDDQRQYYFDMVGETAAAGHESPRNRIIRLRQIYESLLKELTRAELQTFPSAFARSIFVFNTVHLPPNIEAEAHTFRKTANTCVHEMTFVATESHVNQGVKALLQTISFITEKPIPEVLQQQLAAVVNVELPVQSALPLNEITWMRGVVIGIGEPGAQGRRIICGVESPQTLDQITVELGSDWQDVALRQYATVAISALHALRKDVYTTTADSVVVVEPDILIDATAIANCFLQNSANSMINLAGRFLDSTTTEPMVKGNMVGLIFGYLIKDPGASFESCYDRAARQNATALTLLGPNHDATLRDDVRKQFTTLQREVTKLAGRRIDVEATFLSSKYGIQGRLDALVDSQQPLQKQIIELKSGKPVNTYYSVVVDGVPMSVRVWSTQLAQAACYNLIMQSTNPDLTVTENILFSADPISPMRTVEVTPVLRRSIVNLRNRIVMNEWAIANGDATPLRQINRANIADAPPYIISDIVVLERALAAVSPQERAYFEAFSMLIAREHMMARIGSSDPDSNQNGFAALWLNDLSSKEAGYGAIPNLMFERYDRDTKMAYFHSSRKGEMAPTSFREGDAVVIYKHNEDGTADPLRSQLLRGNLRKVSAAAIEIEIRSGELQLDARGFWAVESDMFENGFTVQYKALARFIRATPAKRNLLLGKTKPRTVPWSAPLPTVDLDDHQRKVLKAALEAQDYFLLQGPPGTGKTRMMLKTMIELLYKNTRDNVLLLAYTNRAVSEICEVLEGMKGVDFLRLGNSDGLKDVNTCLDEFSRKKSVDETRQKIQNTRVFVTTISTALNRTELLGYKQFDVAIIDEASQLLEPHLAGLLTDVKRFILIGDEKQLPAVIAQTIEQTTVTDPNLLSLGIKDLRVSLFERLLEVCKVNGWTHAFAMLEKQGRMHEKIQDFPSSRFYDGRLRTMKAEQTAVAQNFSAVSRDDIEKTIASSRVLFIPSNRERQMRTHIEEAQRIAVLLETIYRVYGKSFDPEETVGVITPFRAQISEIRKRLPSALQGKNMTIDTVERFQGSQRDIILMSMAVNHVSQMDTIQSLNPAANVDRKLNVAITRARKHLIILGVAEVLQSQPIYADLLQFIQAQGGLVSTFNTKLLT